MGKPELSIVILCYRSEERIIAFAEEVKVLALTLTSSFEIILVGNYIEGSNDKTPYYIDLIANNDTVYKTVCKPKEGMMGWDMRTGLSITEGKYICVIDGDGQFPIDSIRDCFKVIKTGNFQLVKTYRRKRDDGFYRRMISVFYNLFFKILFPKIKSNDVNSKPKILTRTAYEQMDLESDDWFIDAEIMLNLHKLKLPFHEIPTDFYKLEGRTSFVKISAITEFCKNLIKAWIHFNKNK